MTKGALVQELKVAARQGGFDLQERCVTDIAGMIQAAAIRAEKVRHHEGANADDKECPIFFLHGIDIRLRIAKLADGEGSVELEDGQVWV